MDDFSLYDTVLRTARGASLTVRSLGDVTLRGGEGALDPVTFDTRVESMRLWCRLTERLVTDKPVREAVVHAGFERLSRIAPVARRYRRIAATARELVVYGEADALWDVPGMRAVHLDVGPLRNEWFLLVSSPAFKALLVAEDLDGFGGGRAIADRCFRGFATHHPKLVEDARRVLEARYGGHGALGKSA